MCLYQSLPAKASRPTLRSGPDPTRQNQTLVSPLDWDGVHHTFSGCCSCPPIVFNVGPDAF